MADTVLEIEAGGQDGAAPRCLVLHPGCYRIGRDSAAEVSLCHPAVSRLHALLEQRAGRWLLEDHHSTNGLWWRGQRIRQLLLRDGDCVRFGPADQEGLPSLTFHQSAEPQHRRRLRLLQGTVLSLVAIAGAGLLLLLLALLLQPIRSQLTPQRGPLLIHDRRGRPLAFAGDRQQRALARLQDYPPVLIDALLASEDSRFWWHPGIDPISTGRALLTNLLGGRVLEGGSTLTQQLARSLYPEQVGQGETLARKGRELLVALQLEARFSKHDLLLSYLNHVFLGSGWGFEDASQRLFGRPAAQLQLEQAALLVGLLPSPNGYDPCLAPQAALASRNRVLSKMADSGRISAAMARRARRRPIQLAASACRPGSRPALPFYSDQVQRDLERLVGADVAAEGNFLIDTHLDPALQALVERQLRQRLDASRSLGVSQGAVVLLDSRSNGILALAGGRDYRQSQFNRATMALRQPGSTFKLVPYLVAIERGARPGDPLRCDPLDWMGQHFTSGCRGSISLRQALASSSTTAALRLARRVGLQAVADKARELGFTSPLDPVPGLVLGQSEVTLLELTAAYGAVANDGLWRAPSTIRQLTDAELCPAGASMPCGPEGQGAPGTGAPRRGAFGGVGSGAASRSSGRVASGSAGRAPGRAAGAAASSPRRITGETDGSGPSPATPALMPARRVMQASTARTLRSLLQSVVRGGTGSAASLGGEEGGKTGTTNDGRDLLFVGFEPRRRWVMGIWLGNDDNSPSRGGSALAASLWADIVRASSPVP
ncbi:MAG: transglycosylase domain-containing protein [Cyanobium sp.]